MLCDLQELQAPSFPFFLLFSQESLLTSVETVRAGHVDKGPGVLCLLVYFQQDWDCVILPIFQVQQGFH